MTAEFGNGRDTWLYATGHEREQAEDAYELDDPKHPSFVEQWLDWGDEERKQRKEEGGDA